jgi:DNA-binding transcriptional regulator YbjK
MASALVSSDGLGAVTHRSVEKAGGAPHGSVTYWFGSRDA